MAIDLGSGFIVMGDWDDSPPPEGQIILMPPLPPRVHGAGWSQDTKNCIAALISVLAPGMTFLDLGTGTGLIAVVAKLLGASVVYATEHQPRTRAFAQEVLDLNEVSCGVCLNHAGIPHVDVCVANVGAEYVREIFTTIQADIIITAENENGETVVYAK